MVNWNTIRNGVTQSSLVRVKQRNRSARVSFSSSRTCMALVAFSNKWNQADLVANNRLDLFLRDLDERKGKIPSCQEVSLIQSRVRKVIRSILLEVRRENPFFRTTLINSGSFYEGTKVGQPDEFDFLIQLDGFSGPERILFDELPCSTVGVCPGESTWEDLRYYFPDSGNFEWKKSIKTPFYEIFSKKAKDFEAYGMKVVLKYEADETACVSAAPPLTKHGPAYTLLLEWNGGERYKGLRISVDLALAVKINNRPKVDIDEVESPTWRVLQSLFDNLPCYFAVGAYRDVLSEVNPNYFADCDPSLRPQDFCLRCSQSCLEQALFSQTFGPNSGQAKCLRLLKVLRDIVFHDTEIDFKNSNDSGFDSALAAESLESTGRLVSSYVLKTLVLFEWQQNPADEQWCGNNLSRRLLNTLRSLIDHLKGRKLRSFFYADYNIFPSSVTQDIDFLNAASIITILLDGLAFIDKMNEYNFEECMTKIKEDFVEVIYRKITFTFRLLIELWFAYCQDSSLEKVVEKSLRKEGKEIEDSDDFAKAIRVLQKNGEKSSLWDIYVQALLNSIAPNETLILTNVNVKDTKSLSQAGQQFEKIARRRMATSLDKLPSYRLWTQEHWRPEGSVHKYKTDEQRKLFAFLFSAFREDIDILLNEMKDY